MTSALQKAVERAGQLPPERQDALAQLLIDEIDADQQWTKRFETTSAGLESLAQRALENDKAGRTVEKGWDQL